MPTFFVAAAAGAALVASLFPHSAGPAVGPAVDAQASTMWIEGKTLYFSAADRTVNAVSVETYPEVSGYVLVRDAAGTPIRAVDPCVALAPNLVRCPAAGIAEVITVLRGEDDQFHGGGWKDIVHGGPGKDTLLGGKGNDELHGDAGNDGLDGEAGPDDYGDGGTDNDTCTAERLDNCE